MHANVAAFWLKHPAGRPEYAYVYAGAPPVALTVNVTELPRVTGLGLAVNVVIVSGVEELTTREIPL